jgi:signal transduction histidine kinase
LAKTDLASTLDSEEKKNALESLDEIEKNVVYINKIVADLQDFARQITPVAKETNLKSVVDDILTKSGIPSNIKVKVKVQKEAGEVMADPDILKRVLGNLVTNAVQAMPQGGHLSINGYLEAKDVVITVKDTGVGIPEEARSKLFTPLFTTKSKGQGFGLAVVKRMTEALGGSVTFESEVGKGTTFILRFPPRAKR